MHAIESDETCEVLAVCPDAETAALLCAALGGRLTVYPVGTGETLRRLNACPHAATEWAKRRRRAARPDPAPSLRWNGSLRWSGKFGAPR